MNESIISPWFFYVASIVDSVNNFLSLSLILSGVYMGVYTFFDLMENKQENLKKIKKLFLVWLAVGFICSLIPSKQVVYQMAIAKYITAENIEKAGNLTEKVADKIIEKIIKVSKEMSNSKEK